MGEFLQDLRVGVRQLVRRPAFALTAIGSLALGIGLTTTLFTVVNAVLFKSSPLRDPARLLEVYSSERGQDMQLTTSYLDLQSLRARRAGPERPCWPRLRARRALHVGHAAARDG